MDLALGPACIALQLSREVECGVRARVCTRTHMHAHMKFRGGGTAVLALGATPAASPSSCTAMNVNTGLAGPPRGPAV